MIVWLAVIGFNLLLPGEASALDCLPQSTIGNQQAKIDSLFDRRIAKETVSNLPSANSRSVYRYNGDMVWKESVTADNADTTDNFYLSGDRIDQWLAKQTLDPAPSTFDLSWFQSDRLGSITGVADESGETQESYTYSAFGIRTPISQLPSSISNNLGFTGRELDPETGLYYYRARYYAGKGSDNQS